ncbi:MAG: conjugal transfer protein TraF [Dictyoglomus turgidum]
MWLKLCFKAFVFVLIPTLLFAKEAPQVSTQKEQPEKQPFYYEETQKGWWWYKDYVKEKQPEKTEEPKAEAPKETPKSNVKPLKEYSYQELLRMHPDQLKEIYDFYLKKAVEDPTEENVYNFYNIQEVVRKKSLLFSYMSGYVWQKYPELSLTERDVSSTGPALTKKTELIKEELSRQKARGDYGIVVFVQPGCHYCDTQLKILDYAKLEGVDVKVVDITKVPSARSTFAVEVTPTMIVVSRKTGAYMPLSAGVIPLDEIYRRMSRAIRILEGEPPEGYGMYEFEKGGGLDPLEPPPLWRNTKQEVK